MWMVSGLLFVSFAFFVFAQAAFTRSGAQSAADAAALAAAQESRDELYERFLDALDDGGGLEEILAGRGFEATSACTEAARLAGQNGADVTSCVSAAERLGFLVGVVSRNSVGESVIPGTESQKGSAQAAAVIQPLCEATTQDDDRIDLRCEDTDWSFDPGDEENIPEARDLFQVSLED